MMDHSTTTLTQQQPQQHPQAQPQHPVTDQTALAQQHDGSNKRKQVKNACTNCQKACKKCDDDRPCTRCVKFGIADTCTSSVRKERMKGVKRGPYKRKGKQDEEQPGRKTRKSSGSDTGSNTGEQQHAPPPPPPPMYGQATSATQQGPINYSYDFPPNLNQYHFLPYQFPYYGGDKTPQSGPYAINYPPPMYQYPMPISGQQPTPPPPGTGQAATQSGDTSDTNNKKQKSVEATPESRKVKKETDNNNNKDQAKPQPMTPVPSSSSSSTSSATMSSTDSNQGDGNAKNVRPTDLSSTVSKHEKSTSAATTD